MQSKLSAVYNKTYKKIKPTDYKMWVHLMMIHMDKKSSKSYVSPINFAIPQFCSQ